jgi:hypothetical protein
MAASPSTTPTACAYVRGHGSHDDEALTGFVGCVPPADHEARGHPGQIVSGKCPGPVARQRVHRRKPGHDPSASRPRMRTVALRAAGPRRGPGHPAAARGVVEREIDAATDNPSDLHGPPSLASAQGPLRRQLPCGVPGVRVDFTAIAVTEIGNIAERRLFRLDDGTLTGPARHARRIPGHRLDCGYMFPSTSRRHCPDRKTLAHPERRLIPTCANQGITFRWRTMPPGMRGRWSRTSRVLSDRTGHGSAGTELYSVSGPARGAPLSPRLCSISSAPRRPRMGVGSTTHPRRHVSTIALPPTSSGSGGSSRPSHPFSAKETA